MTPPRSVARRYPPEIGDIQGMQQPYGVHCCGAPVHAAGQELLAPGSLARLCYSWGDCTVRERSGSQCQLYHCLSRGRRKN